jgi:hypothetical protein
MKRAWVVAVCGAVLLLRPGPGPAHAGGDSTCRLYYVFSPDQAEQRLRAVLVDGWTRALAGGPRVFALARAAAGADLEAFRRAERLSMPVYAVASWERLGAPATVGAHLDAGLDYAVAVNAAGETVAAGEGAQLEQILVQLAGPAVSTDVDESTWGKVKELFR